MDFVLVNSLGFYYLLTENRARQLRPQLAATLKSILQDYPNVGAGR